jgi:hypothetical protein
LARPRHLRYLLLAGLSRFAKEKYMADKPTPPDPAEGARRRKRPAPTIDLTATEVPGAKTAEQPQAAADEPPSASPEPSAAHSAAPDEANTAHDPEPRLRTGSTRAAPAIWQIFIAGFVGAAIMTAALLALWFAGLVPSRDAGSAPADPASVTALNQRLAKIESSMAKLPASDQGTSERLSAADNALKSLGIALTAINKRSDEVAANAAEARARADASEKALTELRNSVQDLTKNSSAGLSPADVDSVQKRLAILEQVVKNAPTDRGARLALSAATLRDTVVSGAPFSGELDEVKSLGAGEKALASLAPFAATGVPQAPALAQELHQLIPAMQKAAGAQAPAGSFLDRLQANAGKLVRIRPLDAPAGDDAAAVLTRLDIESTRADIPAALADLERLDSAVRAPAQAWIAKAQARQATLAAARQLAADTARALGKR